MKIRNFIVGLLFLLIVAGFVEASRPQSQKAKVTAASKGVMLMDRIGPSMSELYVANADGTNGRKLLASSGFDYPASWSPDGKWIAFSSDRSTEWTGHSNGRGDEASQYANTFQPYGVIMMMKADGTKKRQLTDSPWEDSMPCFVPKREP